VDYISVKLKSRMKLQSFVEKTSTYVNERNEKESFDFIKG
jgi:hypothetical protein